MEFHDAANIFPLEQADIDEIAEDIRDNGQLDPIAIYEGKILDGRNRWLACQKLGIAPDWADVTKEVKDPIAYVVSKNLKRRQLSATQKAMVAAKVRAIFDDQAKARQVRKPSDSVPAKLPEQKGDARDLAGAAVGVSGKYVDMATKVLEEGTPKLIAAVEADKLGLAKAKQYSSLTDEEQDARADRALASTTKRRKRSEDDDEAEDAEPTMPSAKDIKAREVAISCGHKATELLGRIQDNPFRRHGFRIVTDWIKQNQ